MKIVSSIVAPALLVMSLAACGGGEGGAAPGGSAKPATGGSAKPAAAASAVPAAPAAAKTSAAGSFPAQALPAPFTTLTIGAPPGSKLEPGVTGDYAMIEGADYTFKIEEAKENDVAKLKEMLTKGGGKLTVDQPEGLVADLPQKDGSSSWTVYRYLKVGDKGYKCSTTMKGAPKNADKAQESYDACGTLKAK